MNILEYIKIILGLNKKNAQIYVEDLTKQIGDQKPLEVGIYSNNNPIINNKVTININGRDYDKITNSNGIAKLNINLPVGTYRAKIIFENEEYRKVTSAVDINILPNLKSSRMEGTNINMIEKDGTQYQCAVYDENNNRILCNVHLTINGIRYKKATDNKTGLAKLNLNLPPGTYKITAEYDGDNRYKPSSVTNTIIINKKENKNHFGYWVFGKDMNSVNLQSLKNNGVTDIFLNYYAFSAHGEANVLQWIENAKRIGINVHIWMQCFYNGEWLNPKTTNLINRIQEAERYANMPNVYGIHLDYLRYPGNAYKTNGGTEAINDFVSSVKNVIGNKFLSCAVMPENESAKYYGQDIDVLGKIVDAIIPMQYKGNYNAGSSWLGSTSQLFSSKATIWSGLQSYRSDDDTSLLNSSELSNDIQTCLNNGAKGSIIFRYGLSPDIDFKQFNK